METLLSDLRPGNGHNRYLECNLNRYLESEKKNEKVQPTLDCVKKQQERTKSASDVDITLYQQ